MSVYDISGNQIGINNELNLDYDMCIKNIAHRGFSSIAPENTLPSYILAKKMGFNYAETDIMFTSDGVPMLLHDTTIDRTSNGSGRLSQMTFNQVRQYDFGSWKSPKYAGTQIPSLAELLDLCRRIMLFPLLELKADGGYTEAQIQQVVDMVDEYGLTGKAMYCSFSSNYCSSINTYDPYAEIGFNTLSASTNDLATCQSLKTNTNIIKYEVPYNTVTDAICNTFREANIPMGAWTIDAESDILALNPYITEVTSNSLIAGKVFYDNATAES